MFLLLDRSKSLRILLSDRVMMSMYTGLCVCVSRGEHTERYDRMRWSDLTGDGQASSGGEESENVEKTKLQSA